MTVKLVTVGQRARTLATARLRREICASGLTQAEFGALVGVDARQVRRWLSGRVSLGALEALCALEATTGSTPPVQGRAHAPKETHAERMPQRAA